MPESHTLKSRPHDRSRSTAAIVVLVIIAVDLMTSGQAMSASTATGKAPKPYIGAAMAFLATLEQAQVLPPESTPEANRIIKSVIQFQSAFTKSGDRAVQEFGLQALARHYGERSHDLMAEVRTSGWTPAFIEALADAEQQAPAEELNALTPGFAEFNVSTEDFHHVLQLARAARQALGTRGLAFAEIFASHRQNMPGASARQ
jgi:hypothetical protein